MQDKKIILTPAKLNIFLKVLGKRSDGYHEIRSGVTFINLYDQIELEHDNQMTISYSGDFKPKNDRYDDCIIERTLNFLNIKKDLKLRISIIKNIPVQGGLGSASTNAAALIRAFEDMNIIEKKEPKYYARLGADIPCFLFNKDCIVTGIGENLVGYPFPKYFFLLVKPKFNNSTSDMYKELKSETLILDSSLNYKKNVIYEDDNINDFEKIVKNKYTEFKKIIECMESLDLTIFTRMSGTGSCYYAVFEKKNML